VYALAFQAGAAVIESNTPAAALAAGTNPEKEENREQERDQGIGG
jgi:hypothetical protein